MKSIIPFLAFLTCCTISNSQDLCIQAKKISELIERQHIRPQALNDSLSARIFSGFFRLADPEHRYFTTADIHSLENFRFQLDDEIVAQKCAFVKAGHDLLKKKLQWSRRFADSLFKKPFDYSKKEVLSFSKAIPFSRDEKELINRLSRRIKYDVEMTIYRQQESEEKELTLAAFQSLEPSEKQRTARRELKDIDTFLSDPEKLMTHVQACYLKALLQANDPHSDYFSYEDIAKFEEHLNPEGLYFGLGVNENALGQLQIADLVPGGPAWKSNELHEGDLLISLSLRDKYFDALDYNADEIDELLNSAEYQHVEVTVRTADGQTKKVKLAKEKMANEENSISGFLLKDKKSIGYISLPAFYKGSPEDKRSGCADDVAKEIIKLKKEKIEGLILDLRSNGGGFTGEAIELAGLFIDFGTLAVMQGKEAPPISLKDISKGLVYDGPLVVIVNGASASASELVAAALQDYQRAIVVGSKTFGKATGQQVFPVTAGDNKDGFIKTTTDRIYRVTGSSLQRIGVVPDVTLPDLMDFFVRQEAELNYSLPVESITKKIYYTPWQAVEKQVAVAASRERVASSDNFARFKELRRFFETPFPLEQNAFIATMNSTKRLFDQRSFSSTSNHFVVVNNKVNASLLAIDKYHEEANKQLLEAIANDPYIGEAYTLLLDSLN